LVLLPGCGGDSEGPAGPTEPVCSLDVQSLSFGAVNVGEILDLNFKLKNTGGGTLAGTVSEACADFSIVGNASYSLGAGDSATFTVRFFPGSAGNQACTIETGASQCADLTCSGTGVGGDYYVDASSGSDTNPGTFQAPFRTITFAVAAAGPDKVICIRPGTYDAALGEVFPIRLQQGQSLVGDTLNKGAGTTPTTIYGSGDADPAPTNPDYLAVLVGADESSIMGLSIGAPYAFATYGVYVVEATISVLDNTFISVPTESYAGVLAIRNGASSIMRNEFLTVSYGVYSINSAGGMVVEDNLFETMSIPVNIAGATDNTLIRGNTFIGSGQVAVQVFDGAPVIENNMFNKPGGYATYGAIRCAGSSANATVRGNTFICARGVGILNAATPDLGSASVPGGNDFSGVTGPAIDHTGTGLVSAVGNTWASSPPVCGSEIVVTGAGSVIWGTEAGEICP
jgi:hypothetical protein